MQLLVTALMLCTCTAFASSTVLRFNSNPNRDCNQSPSVWCGSDDVAEACGVSSQCRSAKRVQRTAAEPVEVTIYMESLCPDCKAFFNKQLYPAWRKLNASGIMMVDVVPYGNAKETIKGHRWIFECQHGPAECEGNQVETCAIGMLNDKPDRWMAYLSCVEERSTADNMLQVAEQCAVALNISWDHINTCSHNEWGDKLEHWMAERTRTLNPPLQYVPWVTINGVHNEDIQKQAEANLLQLVCSTYKGAKPAECTQAVASRCYK
ncbi:hypothetical protein BOX15_Mlig022516g1 [Macrostomum lignano]|uniref:Saposin A-type domain-containing protein n=2 Tax=Macrostomum lignano TaxID=282301 RepID=A0A1I8HNL5_9PLAT|nr:hypothetical protein BOX15_Mlig022516g1 [Macrostomum lignano]